MCQKCINSKLSTHIDANINYTAYNFDDDVNNILANLKIADDDKKVCIDREKQSTTTMHRLHIHKLLSFCEIDMLIEYLLFVNIDCGPEHTGWPSICLEDEQVQIVTNNRNEKVEIYENTQSLLVKIIKYVIEYKCTLQLSILRQRNIQFQIKKVSKLFDNARYIFTNTLTSSSKYKDAELKRDCIQLLSHLALVDEMNTCGYSHRAYHQLKHIDKIVDFDKLDIFTNILTKKILSPQSKFIFNVDTYTDSSPIDNCRLSAHVDAIDDHSKTAWMFIYSPYNDNTDNLEYMLTMRIFEYDAISPIKYMNIVNMYRGTCKQITIQTDDSSTHRLDQVIVDIYESKYSPSFKQASCYYMFQ
jgi:hypothetical protein